MRNLSPEEYNVEDFIADETFINFHLKSKNVDEQYWIEWIEAHPSKINIVNEARQKVSDLSFNISEEEYLVELEKLKAAINKRRTGKSISQVAHKPGYPTRKSARRILWLAACLLLIIVPVYWALYQKNDQKEKLIVRVNEGSNPLELLLSDSTIVRLAPHSSLRFPPRFGNVRNVYLDGNAQFNVKRNEKQPFKVYSENMITIVLGTIFNIKRSGDSALVVELLKGKLKVEIENAKPELGEFIILAPNEKAVYVRSNKRLYKNLLEENHFTFRKSTFDDVAAQIKKVFGIILMNASKSRSWSFTGEFRNTTAGEMVENICLIKNLSFEERGDTIIIK